MESGSGCRNGAFALGIDRLVVARILRIGLALSGDVRRQRRPPFARDGRIERCTGAVELDLHFPRLAARDNARMQRSSKNDAVAYCELAGGARKGEETRR